jgi:hypothetical protein
MGRRSYCISRRRHAPEQVVRKLREADRLLGEGIELPEVFKALEVSEQMYYRWRNQFGGMKADDVKRLKERLSLRGGVQPCDSCHLRPSDAADVMPRGPVPTHSCQLKPSS